MKKVTVMHSVLFLHILLLDPFMIEKNTSREIFFNASLLAEHSHEPCKADGVTLLTGSTS